MIKRLLFFVKMSLRGAYGFVRFRRLGIFLGLDARIDGARYIKIGAKFGAGRNFWMSAIDGYGQQKFSPQIAIGHNVSFSDACHVAAIQCVEIGNNVLFGSRVHVTDHSHGSYEDGLTGSDPDSVPLFRPLFCKGSVSIADNVWVGDGAVILSNVKIGRGAIVAANSVVTRDVAPFTIVGGVPAKAIKVFIDGRWTKL